MKIRCNNPECRTVVEVNEGFIRVDNRIFCSVSCSNHYLKQTERFNYTTQTLQQFAPLNYKPKRWWT
jgi:hypothetical protein